MSLPYKLIFAPKAIFELNSYYPNLIHYLFKLIGRFKNGHNLITNNDAYLNF